MIAPIVFVLGTMLLLVVFCPEDENYEENREVTVVCKKLYNEDLISF